MDIEDKIMYGGCCDYPPRIDKDELRKIDKLMIYIRRSLENQNESNGKLEAEITELIREATKRGCSFLDYFDITHE